MVGRVPYGETIVTTDAGLPLEASFHPRFASRGRTFVYVLPCRDEDILKVIASSPSDLQPVRSAGQQLGIRGCDLAPLSAVSVVPLSQTPKIITHLHNMLVASVIDLFLPRRSQGRGLRSCLGRLDDQCHWPGRSCMSRN